MKSYINILQSVLFVCCAVPSLTFGENHESVDTEVVTGEIKGTEQEAHCGYGNGYVFDHYRGSYLPGSAHIITQISALGDEIRMEDGSAWKVNPYDCSQAVQWLDKNTPVSIMQNTSWFSNHTFRIVNRQTGSSIVANLFKGPEKGGEKTQYVVEYDLAQGTLKLRSPQEITHWKIHPADLTKLQEWNFADSVPVIIGQNADYDANWNAEWEGLLINVRKTKNFVRAHQY